jgi:TRAP-type uncharacterized transport system substrate-binding protein
MIRFVELGFNAQDFSRRLQSGEIDGFFWVGGLPTAAISELLKDSKYNLVDVAAVQDGWNSDRVAAGAIIPPGSYPGQNQLIATFSFSNVLFASKSARERDVALIRKVLEENKTFFDQKFWFLRGWSPSIPDYAVFPIPIFDAKPQPSIQKADHGNNAPSSLDTLLKSAREKCLALGMKPNTEKYGECVLRLGRGR